MVRAGLSLVIVVAGCGRIGFSPPAPAADAGMDAPAACAAYGPWAPPVPLVELNTARDDWGPTLSTDRLTLYFESDRLRGGTPEVDLYQTTRPAPGAPWGAPSPVDTINLPGVEDANPELSHDGLTLYFTSTRASSYHALFRATRGDPAAAFTTAEIVPELAGETVLGPTSSRDGNELYYASSLASADIKRAVRDAGGAFGPGEIVVELSTATEDGWPTLFGEDLAMYFHSARDAMSSTDLYVTTRPAVGAAWSAPIRDTSVSFPPPASEVDVEVSADGLEMIFASDRAGGSGRTDLYTTTRSCL